MVYSEGPFIRSAVPVAGLMVLAALKGKMSTISGIRSGHVPVEA
jgi:hypothetical protein